MGILIPPFMKSIIGMATTLVSLFMYCSPTSQCSVETLRVMTYLVLKDLLFLGVSTKLANQHILRKVKTKEKLKEKL